MDKNSIEYSFQFVNPNELLLWLILLCLIVVAVTSALMSITSRFFVYEQDKKIVKFSIFTLEFPFSYKKFSELLTNISDKTKDAIRTSLKLDNYFMPGMYLFLFFFSLYTLWFYYRCGTRLTTYWFLILPFACWIFDLVENRLISSSLDKVSKTKTNAILAVSLAKWCISVCYGLLTVYYLIAVNKNC